MEDVVGVFFKLVQIDSPSGFEKNVGSYLKKWLDKVGFEWKEDEIGNILGYKNEYTQKPILIGAHMDTVEPGRSIRPVIKNGTILSDGSTILGADNKASIAAMIVAVNEYVKESGRLPDVELLFSVKEETGGGVELFPFKWIHSKSGFLFDYAKPLGRVVIASPYIYNFKITFKGKASHASRPEEGRNSLVPAVKFIRMFPVGRFDNGKTTINIGRVTSGTGINVIPEDTIVEGEVRSTNKLCFDRYIKKIKDVLRSCLEHSLVKADLCFDGYCNGYEYSKKDPEIKNISLILEGLNFRVGYDKSMGISDANPLVGAGIKAVNLSDGVEGAHTKYEKITIENLKTLRQIISVILRKVPQLTF